MELNIYHTLSDLYQSLHLPVIQDIDFTVHFLPDIHKKTPFVSPVFRAEYFSFVFIKDGVGSYTIDDKKFPFYPYTIYFTNPGHIKSFEIRECHDGYIITLTAHFLRENVHPDIFEEFPFLLAELVPPIHLNSKEFQDFEVLYKQLFNELHANTLYKKSILGNLFVVLLLKIKEQFWLSYDPREEGNSNSRIVKAFKKLLEHEFKKITSPQESALMHQVRDYADILKLHPNYLNSVIKSKTGKTVNDWIKERMISSAKSLLKNTSLSSKEIAFRLGFSEPTHFNRFFKKHIGVSPGSFRKSMF